MNLFAAWSISLESTFKNPSGGVNKNYFIRSLSLRLQRLSTKGSAKLKNSQKSHLYKNRSRKSPAITPLKNKMGERKNKNCKLCT